MASLGVQPHVISKLLNHVSGIAAISGVAAIYNRFQYMDEMRAAIALWEERLSSLLALLAQHGPASPPQHDAL